MSFTKIPEIARMSAVSLNNSGGMRVAVTFYSEGMMRRKTSFVMMRLESGEQNEREADRRKHNSTRQRMMRTGMKRGRKRKDETGNS